MNDVPPPTGTAPTLFPGGDLPAVTASGIDPKVLLKVPWQARRALARASQSEAYDILDCCSGPDGELRALFDARFANDIEEYNAAVSRWKSGF